MGSTGQRGFVATCTSGVDHSTVKSCQSPNCRAAGPKLARGRPAANGETLCRSPPGEAPCLAGTAQRGAVGAGAAGAELLGTSAVGWLGWAGCPADEITGMSNVKL